jgi:hypothetical protein
MQQRSTVEVLNELRSSGATGEEMLAVAVLRGLELVAAEIRAVAHGDEEGPGGLEAVTVGIAGVGLRDSLAKAVRANATALQSVADAVTTAVSANRKESTDGQ